MNHKLSFIITLLTAYIVLYSCKKGAENVSQPPPVVTPPVIQTPRGVHGIAGVNWADTRDNFVDGWIVLSGLNSVDDYSTVSEKTASILSEFSAKIPAVNTIRIPVNPQTVLESWWSSYKAIVDKATARGYNVIIACWEAASSRNGKIDDETKFWQMWDVIAAAYQANTKVYFEPFNEPHGYTLSQLTTFYKQFLDKYPSATRNRIILGGTGYSEDVNDIGSDIRFADCLLSLHNYAFWTTRTASGWRADWRRRVGAYAARTVITEFGAGMTTGKDYQNGDQSDNEIAYIVATSDVCRTDSIASVYWPGLRDGDSYSLTTRSGAGNSITLNTTNASGVFRLRYGWGF